MPHLGYYVNALHNGEAGAINGGGYPTTAVATRTISATGSVTGTYTGSSVSDGPLSGSFTGTRITLSGSAAPSYQTAYNTCYVGTPILYTSVYCNAYANAMVAGSTAESANQAGANAAGGNVGNVGTGQVVTEVGTPNTGGASTVTCVAPKITYNNACVTPVASLAFNKSELSYAPQANGTASAAQSVTLTNTGNTGILLKSSLSVPPLAQWNVVNTNCPSGSVVFAAGSSCTISINFTPRGDDSKLAAYTLQQSQGLNPSPIPNDLYTGAYEVWGDSVTTPQIAVPKATVLLSASGVYPVSSAPPSSGGTPSFASMATSGTWTHFGITATGELWGWGRNNKGQLGDGTTTETNKPKLIGSGYASVAGGFGGDFYVMAVKKDGSLMYWGGDIFNSGAANVLTPKVIGSGFAKVAPSTYSQAAIKTDGSLWVWGLNSSGVAGDGTRNPISAPKQIGTGYSTVSVGTTHRMAVKLDGSLWAWGSPTCGALSSAGAG